MDDTIFIKCIVDTTTIFHPWIVSYIDTNISSSVVVKLPNNYVIIITNLLLLIR
jgi:hypothetical protein